ncbi:MAG TPA: lipid-A-disaccharide synthase N-terminal domain-containing protein [Verrucomicrobiales bacterium]|nr:lipid-A-disaccharide synthase N-terminal domain-containing protein [Verrucomicrobiales bacterium]
MNSVLLEWSGVTVTPWKIIGYLGVLLFGGRWVIQILASRRLGRPALPAAFWHMSLAGSLLLVLYFVFGKNDSVGIIQNVIPAGIAGYNLFLEAKRQRAGPSSAEQV